jgi:hypothetical protein
MQKLGIFESSLDYYKRFERDSASRLNSIKINQSLLEDLKGLYAFCHFVATKRKHKPINLNFLSKDGAYNDLCQGSERFNPKIYNVFVQTDRTNEGYGKYNFTSYSSLYLLVYLALPLFFLTAFFSCLRHWSFVKDVGVVKCLIRYSIFLSKRFIFSSLVKLCKTKTIHLVDSYSTNQALNFVAKQIEIPVIEIQHGIISKGHIGYNRLYMDDSFYPDELLLLSHKFVQHIPMLQLDNIRYKITKLDYFNRLDTYKNKENKILVIIGQPSISSLLLELYKNLALKGIRVMYKPHPRELIQSKQEIKIFNKQKFNANHCYIGGFSTLLLELVEAGCSDVIAIKESIPDHYDQVLIDFGISLLTIDEIRNIYTKRVSLNEL